MDKYVINKHLLILKSEIYKNAWEKSLQDKYINSLENENYLVQRESYKNLGSKEFKAVIKNNKFNNKTFKKMKKGLDFSISSSYNYNAMVVTFIAINDELQNKNIAYLVIYTESDHLDRLLVESHYSQILLLSILLVLFIFSLYITNTQRPLEQMAHFDKLTGLPNRAYFYIELAQEIKRASRLGQKLSLMFIDLDGFKNINDTYGHNSGDILLIETAHRLTKSIRNMDIAARIGGDEFIVLLTNVKSESDATHVAQKIIDKLNEDFKISKQILNIGASIGIASFPADTKNIDTLVSYADAAMYEAKENGKNSFVLFSNNKK
jgi:diguanylate cyclase (GGDEF)-like protein